MIGRRAFLQMLSYLRLLFVTIEMKTRLLKLYFCTYIHPTYVQECTIGQNVCMFDSAT